MTVTPASSDQYGAETTPTVLTQAFAGARAAPNVTGTTVATSGRAPANLWSRVNWADTAGLNQFGSILLVVPVLAVPP